MSYTPSTSFSFDEASYTPSTTFNFDDSLNAEIADPSATGALDTVAFGVIIAATLADPAASGEGEAFAAQVYLAELYHRSADITQQIFETYDRSATIEQSITETTYSIAAPIQQAVFETTDLAAPIRQIIYGTSALAAPYWALQVWLGTTDISTRLTGTVTVDAEEGAARIADLTLVPTAGAFTPQTYVNKPLRIEYIALSSAGVEQARFPVFQGVVDTPEIDPIEGTVKLSLTDDLQRFFDGRSRAEIATEIGGHWANWVFDPDADPWSYAQDRMSTQAASFDLDINRQPRKTAWAAKTTPDFAFTGASPPLDGSLSIRLSSGKSLVNHVRARVQYRYERLLERRAAYTWTMTTPQVIDGKAPPTPQIIAQAIQGTGWSAHQVTMRGLPNPGYYTNSHGAEIGYLSDCPRYTFAASAAFTLSKRWAQTITEDWTIDIKAPASIAGMGHLWSEYRHSATNEIDRNDPIHQWTDLQDYLARVKLYDAGPFSPNCDRVILEHHLEVQKYAQAASGLSRFAATGDYYKDLDSQGPTPRARFQDGFQAIVAKARTDILSSHRDTTVTASVPIAPRIDRTHTVSLDTGTIAAQGKVRQVRHEFDLGSGAATTTISIAVSKPFGYSATGDTPISAPAKPTATQASESVTQTTHLQTWETAQPAGTAGWDPASGRFSIPVTGVDNANVQATSKTTRSSYTVAIPDDDLTLEIV
jgi:hypothetical protein